MANCRLRVTKKTRKPFNNLARVDKFICYKIAINIANKMIQNRQPQPTFKKNLKSPQMIIPNNNKRNNVSIDHHPCFLKS